ncbi:MAG: D-2-hydroxyacid dehydrogenase (NADP+) [Chlamydiales bacterium]|jgi:D-2-hydroxyacid dehydrogenase (NADP+)
MNIIFLKSEVLPNELKELRDEFPQYEFFSPQDIESTPLELLKVKYWDYVEVLYGDNFAIQELSTAHQLRWVHSPSPHMGQVCLDEIYERKNILLTKTAEPNRTQISEFAITGILSLGKQLFHWHDSSVEGSKLWGSPPERESTWMMKGRLLLQVGLGTVGSSIADLGQKMGMRVWGVAHHRTFHSYCHKTFSPQELHSILPVADIVSLCLPKDKSYKNWFGQSELELMKNDSILVIISPSGVVDIDLLGKVAESGKFRGILLDHPQNFTLPKNSPLKDLPNVICTPDVASCPRSTERMGFRTFRHNLRQYVHGNFAEMKNLMGKTLSS